MTRTPRRLESMMKLRRLVVQPEIEASEPPTLIDVLNDPEGPRMVDAIDDVLVSLKGREDDPDLLHLLRVRVERLERATGYRYGAHLLDGQPEGPEAVPHPPAAAGRPREGSKQAAMIALLHRPEGATIKEIADVTGWQRHTVRAAIAGTLKRKLGLRVNAERTADRGTIYRIID